MVLFENLEGAQPDERGVLERPFEQRCDIAARTHYQLRIWHRQDDSERLIRNVETVSGTARPWGNWRAAWGHVIYRNVLERITRRLAAFAMGRECYEVIHADTHLAKLLVFPIGPSINDCSFGWFLRDSAAGISFIAYDPRIPALKAARMA